MVIDISVLTVISCVGFISIGLSILYLKKTVEVQNALLDKAFSQIREFVLASMAYQASKEIHPMTGPAVLQQLKKTTLMPPAPLEKPKEKTGVSIRQGLNSHGA